MQPPPEADVDARKASGSLWFASRRSPPVDIAIRFFANESFAPLSLFFIEVRPPLGGRASPRQGRGPGLRRPSRPRRPGRHARGGRHLPAGQDGARLSGLGHDVTFVYDFAHDHGIVAVHDVAHECDVVAKAGAAAVAPTPASS